MSDGMSKGEREELVKLAKSRARVAKGDVDLRKAGLMADYWKEEHRKKSGPKPEGIARVRVPAIHRHPSRGCRPTTPGAGSWIPPATTTTSTICRTRRTPSPNSHYLTSEGGRSRAASS